MEKVKVDKEIFDALNNFKNRVGEGNFKKKLNLCVIKNDLMDNESVLRYKVNINKLVDIAYCGYELEKNPEEIILERFERNNTFEKSDFEEGVKFGIRYTLNSYGYKIKGVND